MAYAEPTYLATKNTGDSVPAADINSLATALSQLWEDINTHVVNNSGSAPTDNMEGLNTRVSALESVSTPTAKELYTRDHGGFHGEFYYKDSDEITIRCKYADGLGSWIGVMLNDGTYLELTSNTTIKYDTPGNSGHIIDGITAKLNDQWFVVWAYEDSGGALAFGITWMPNDTFSNANPTNTLTLSQVNGQDIGFLYPADAHIVCWQDADEWETPLAWMNTGAVTYDPSKDKPKISSRTSTVLTLGANLENNDLTAGSYAYQVAGFKPLQVSDGAIASVIGTRGYKDSGFRFRTNASGNIWQFVVIGDKFFYCNGSGAADYGLNAGVDFFVLTGSLRYRITFVPPDKSGGIGVLSQANSYTVSGPYWTTYKELIQNNANGSGIAQAELRIIHQILWIAESADSSYVTRGFIL